MTKLRLAWLAPAAMLSLSLPLLGCTTDEGSATQDVTDIINSSVKNQSIGNCWIYASVGWVEALRLTHAGEELNLSESYVTYWHWFEEIRGGAPGEEALGQLETKDGVSQISTGGRWVTAAELMLRYGIMDEGKFIPSEAEAATSSRQRSALSAINASLRSGVLADAAKRRDAATVRAELDTAWGLTPEVIAVLDQVFGAGVEKTLYDQPDVPADSGLRSAKSLEVGHSEGGQILTLADAVGKPSYSYWGVSGRTGTYAWNQQSYPSGASARRQFQTKVQDAMHRRLPAVMSWFVDFNALENDNTFRSVPSRPGRQGGHMTVVEDYEVENVPGYGVLAAGTLVTDPAALEAALSPEAKIRFFRIKNSWGSSLSPDPGQGDALKGYYDLWMTYLDATIPKSEGSGTANGLTGVVLPPASFQSGGGEPDNPAPPDPVTGCAHELCVTGAALAAACDPCVQQIAERDPFCVENSWDSTCVEEVTEICGQTCAP